MLVLVLVSVHTRSSYIFGMLPGSSVERSQVAALARLEILKELGVLPMDEERVVLRQPPHPQVPYEVGRILVVVVYPLSRKEKTIQFHINKMHTIEI